MAIDLPAGIQQALDESMSGRDFSGTNAAPVIPGTNMPVAPLSAQPAPPAPDEQPSYNPGSLADKISSAYLQHLAENQPKKPQPTQSTGQKFASAAEGVMGALGDAAHATDHGRGILAGVTNTLNARNARIAQQNRDEDLHAKSQAETVAMHRNTARLDKADREESYKGNQTFADTYKPNHKEEVINHSELVKRMQDPTFVDDHYVRATQDEPVIDPATGEQKKDKFGNPVTSPLYTVITRNTLDGSPDDKTVDDSMSAGMKKYLGQDMPKGTKLTSDQYNALDVQLNSTRNAVNTLQNTNEKEFSDEQMKSLSPYLTDPLIQAAISAVPGSSYQGLLMFEKNADQHLNQLQSDLATATASKNQPVIDKINKNIEAIAAEKQKVTTFMSQAISPKQIERYDKEGDKQGQWVDKMLHDPNVLSGDKAASAIPQLQEALKTETDPGRIAKLTSALNIAKSAQDNYFHDMDRKAKADQVAKQGDPVAAGKMLASGDLTLADLRTRQTTADFILQATAEAKKIDSSYNPADEINFEHVAKSPQAAVFFGSARSLLSKGGTLDQLVDWGNKIPDNSLPVLNKIEDWQKLAAGKGPLAGYAALVLGAADDYGKVMGGGTASDSARDAALHLFAAAQTQEQRLDAIRGTLGGVGSQYDSRIGKNKFLKREYGDFSRSPLAPKSETAAATPGTQSQPKVYSNDVQRPKDLPTATHTAQFKNKSGQVQTYWTDIAGKPLRVVAPGELPKE